MRVSRGLLVVTLLASTGAAEAQSLRQRQAQAEAERRIASDVTSTNQACGTNIAMRFDWASFRASDFTSNQSLEGWCRTPLQVMRNMCAGSNGALARSAVQANVREVVCRRADERQMLLDNGTATFTITFSSTNDYDFVFAFLLDRL
jgi:hypothetical protein